MLALAWPRAVAAQGADPKAAFFQAVARFSVAVDGADGDEGRAVRDALDAMSRGLVQWDTTIKMSETALAAELPRADSALAARMHLALGAAYLDRSRLEDALREFSAAARLDPGRTDGFTFQGVAYDQAAGNAERAAAFFRQAANLDPGNPVLVYELGRALSRSGKKADALQAFETVLRLWNKSAGEHAPVAHATPFIRLGLIQERSGVEPFFPPVLYAEGFALLTRGDFARAIDAFKRSAAGDPLVTHDVDPRDALGMAASASRRGDSATAIQALKVEIEREPDRADAHRLLGRVLMANHQNDEGIQELRLAVRLSHGGEREHLALGDALVELRRYPEAESAFQDAIKALPASGRAHYRLGRLYQRQNKTLEALGEFETAVKLNPLIGANRLLQAIGALNAARQNFDAAVQAYSRRVDIHPNDAEGHRVLGYTYSRLERREEAFAEFAIALWLAPETPDIYVAMSQLHMKNGDFSAAADAARQAIRLNSSNKQAHYSLGTALMRMEKPDEARPEFEAFERLQAEDTAAAARQMTINGLRREAAASAENRDYQHAVTTLRRALELSPDAFEVHEQLAAVYAALGQRDDSERELAASRRLRNDALAREAAR